MNNEQLRDQIAYAQGWSTQVVADPMGSMFGCSMTVWSHHQRGIASQSGHPIANTFETAIEILRGWNVRLYINEAGMCIAKVFNNDATFERSAPDPQGALFAVVVAILQQLGPRALIMPTSRTSVEIAPHE